ncbi:MAG TPA: hypothetical protein VEJ19_08880 [Nitrososphaerales archaeon]|nr:hypothetical protein [Nitrososphaerales archaeon]
MNRGRLAPVFLIISVVLIILDFFLPSVNGLGLIGQLAEWGLLGLSLAFLVLAVAFRGRTTWDV